MFKRCLTLMVISSLVVPTEQGAQLNSEQQALNQLLAQLASTHEGVYIETVLRGFTKLAEGAQLLLIPNEPGSLGTKCLLEGVAQLTACALQDRNNNDTVSNEQAVAQVETLVGDFRANLAQLLQFPKQVLPVSTANGVSIGENTSVSTTIDVDSGANSESKPSDKPAEPANSEKLLVEGLTQIFYNVFCMLISPNDIGLYLKNVFTGLLKVISAVLADGKIERDDLENLSSALSSIFNLRALQDQMAVKQQLFKAKTRQVNSALTTFEQQQMASGLALIKQSFTALLAQPQNALIYLQQFFRGVLDILVSIFADGKVDQHDLSNAVTVITAPAASKFISNTRAVRLSH